jgi:ADP-ribosylation factor-like protein 3
MKETVAELDQLLIEEKLQGVPLIVFANKQDLLNALSVDEIRDTLRLKNISERKWTIQSCSSKTGEGLEEGFQWVMANMLHKSASEKNSV